MTEHITLQRQGVAHSLNGSFSKGYIEVVSWQGSVEEWAITISYPSDDWSLGELRGQTAKRERIQKSGVGDAKRATERLIREHFGLDVQIADEIEAYCFASEHSLTLWPHIADDLYFTCAVYEQYSDTIRHPRTNVCLIAFDSEHRFDIDAANKPYREICKRGYAEYQKEHNQRKADHENKGWLAWLIGEWIKDELHEEPVKLQSMIRPAA